MQANSIDIEMRLRALDEQRTQELERAARLRLARAADGRVITRVLERTRATVARALIAAGRRIDPVARDREAEAGVRTA